MGVGEEGGFEEVGVDLFEVGEGVGGKGIFLVNERDFFPRRLCP